MDSDRLGRSLESQATGLRKQVAPRDSLANGDVAWLESQERSDMLARAQTLNSEARAAFAHPKWSAWGATKD